MRTFALLKKSTNIPDISSVNREIAVEISEISESKHDNLLRKMPAFLMSVSAISPVILNAFVTVLQDPCQCCEVL